MANKDLKKILVNKNKSIKEAMRIIDRNGLGIAFVIDKKEKLFGVVTDGDIRRAILKGANIEKPIREIANENPIVIKDGFKEKEISELKRKRWIKKMVPRVGSLKVPVVDRGGLIKNIIFLCSGKKEEIQPLKRKPEYFREGVKKILITGGACYLGSVLCRRLLKNGYKVRVLDNLTYGDEGIRELYQNRNFEFLKGDIRNIPTVMKAIRGMDAVIHLAAIVGDPASEVDAKETLEINYLSTKAVGEVCKLNQINKFLFSSTCSVYGASKNPDERLKEDSITNPISLYAETKLKSEEGILSLADENFAPTIFRFPTLYGISARMRFDLVVNLMVAKALIDKKIIIFGGEQWRPNLDVSDAARACLKWLESPIAKSGRKIFNVGVNEQNYQILKIGKMIQKIIPAAEIKIKKEKRDVRNYNVSFDRISKILNFKAKTIMEKGILEIKKLVERKKIRDFSRAKYDNYRFLSTGTAPSVFK